MYRSTNCHKKSRLLATVRFPDLNFTWELGWTFPVRNWDFGFLNAKCSRVEFTLTFFDLNATTEWLISNFLIENNEVCLTFRTKLCSVSSSFTFVYILQFSRFFEKFRRNWVKTKNKVDSKNYGQNIKRYWTFSSIESKLKLLTFLFGFQKSFLTRNSKNINFASVNYIHFADFWDRLIFARFFLSSVESSKQRQKSNSIRSLKTKYSVQ